MTKRPKYILDTSIHIKRLTSKKWRENSCDLSWGRVEPVFSNYNRMELKNTIVMALSLIVSILEDLYATSRESECSVTRLDDLVSYLCTDSTRRNDRRVKLAINFAMELNKDLRSYESPLTVDKVISLVKYMARDYVEFWFTNYQVEGGNRTMEVIDLIECYLGSELDPIVEKGGRVFSCRKGELTCGVKRYVVDGELSVTARNVKNGIVRVKDERLKEGCCNLLDECKRWEANDSSCIGQNMCFPLGDLFISGKAKRCGYGLFTADKDQAALGEHFGVPVLFYEVSTGIVR